MERLRGGGEVSRGKTGRVKEETGEGERVRSKGKVGCVPGGQ